jgi:glycerol-3-phosphate acyltransferase PlsY
VHWALGLAAMLTWVLMAYAFRYSSLASLTASLLAPVFYVLGSGGYWYTETSILLALCLMAALLALRHRENIVRLLQGKESRLGQDKSKDKSKDKAKKKPV